MSGRRKTLIIATAFLCATAAAAAETILYDYDARGRLVKVERSGSVNDKVKTNYVHDRADNRTRKKVTGASK